MIEKINLTGHDGYRVMDKEKKQGVFVFYYTPSKKVVLFELWENKQGDIKLAYNKRKNCNVNIQPAIAGEVMQVIGMVAGVRSEPNPPKENAEVGQRSANYDIGKDIKNLGV